jgi:hypothetical protein
MGYMGREGHPLLAATAAMAALIAAIWWVAAEHESAPDSPATQRNAGNPAQDAGRASATPREEEAPAGKVRIRPDPKDFAAQRYERQRERMIALVDRLAELDEAGLGKVHPTVVAVQRETAEILQWMTEQPGSGSMRFRWPPAEETGETDGSPGHMGVVLDYPPLRVKSLYPGSPAERADLLPGDILLAVDGQSLDLPLAEAMSHLRGAPGEYSLLTLQRPGEEGVRQVALVRVQIPPP